MDCNFIFILQPLTQMKSRVLAKVNLKDQGLQKTLLCVMRV